MYSRIHSLFGSRYYSGVAMMLGSVCPGAKRYYPDADDSGICYAFLGLYDIKSSGVGRRTDSGRQTFL